MGSVEMLLVLSTVGVQLGVLAGALAAALLASLAYLLRHSLGLTKPPPPEEDTHR